MKENFDEKEKTTEVENEKKTGEITSVSELTQLIELSKKRLFWQRISAHASS